MKWSSRFPVSFYMAFEVGGGSLKCLYWFFLLHFFDEWGVLCAVLAVTVSKEAKGGEGQNTPSYGQVVSRKVFEKTKGKWSLHFLFEFLNLYAPVSFIYVQIILT